MIGVSHHDQPDSAAADDEIESSIPRKLKKITTTVYDNQSSMNAAAKV